MKKNNKKILISIFVFFIVSLISISIIIVNNSINKEFSVNKEKIYYQIKYLDNEFIYISNLINSNNWNEIQDRIEKIYGYWNSTILDLNNLSIDKRYLTDFGKTLDNLIVSAKNFNKQSTLDNILNLHNSLCIYSENLNYNTNYTNMLLAKHSLLTAYSIAENGNWTLTHENIVKSSKYLANVVTSMDINRYSQYNINQAYIAIKELENLINVKDLELFYLKYNIAMQKIQNI